MILFLNIILLYTNLFLLLFHIIFTQNLSPNILIPNIMKISLNSTIIIIIPIKCFLVGNNGKLLHQLLNIFSILFLIFVIFQPDNSLQFVMSFIKRNIAVLQPIIIYRWLAEFYYIDWQGIF